MSLSFHIIFSILSLTFYQPFLFYHIITPHPSRLGSFFEHLEPEPCLPPTCFAGIVFQFFNTLSLVIWPGLFYSLLFIYTIWSRYFPLSVAFSLAYLLLSFLGHSTPGTASLSLLWKSLTITILIYALSLSADACKVNRASVHDELMTNPRPMFVDILVFYLAIAYCSCPSVSTTDWWPT